ncbi:MAG: hypothetical protein AB7J13_00815 [Pyrinomonadaceae bacterium]
MAEPTLVRCNDLDEALHSFKELGYRLDMIFPADSPREALMSRLEPPALAGGSTRESLQREIVRLKLSQTQLRPSGSDWIAGRAGMEYRDLIPGRMEGAMIASHIRLGEGGMVSDYVHYHKVDFQMIRCIKGRIKVVYEDQGPPFWLEEGDWVIQPPEIRHRVLECSEGSEVIEISMPAEHETWVDHYMALPNDIVDPDRDFSGQKFVRYKSRNRFVNQT